jgi:tRNA pseudouridine55 synthase
VTGLLLVDKPEGMSSAGAIRVLKPRFAGAKVGHLGTLDPFASGLLPLCVGEATKVARYLLLERKAYSGTIQLGVATDSLDRTGTVTDRRDVPALTTEAVQAAAAQFVGRQRQVPPMFSALKRGGVPLYRLARRGIEVEREAREIEIERLELTWQPPDRIDFAVGCSKGTYVRVLAEDVGRALGTVAHLHALRRTAVGSFAVEDARPPEVLAAMDVLPLVPIRRALAGLRAFDLDDVAVAQLRRGQQAVLSRLPAATPGEAALVLDAAGAVASLIEGGPEGWHVARMLGA